MAEEYNKYFIESKSITANSVVQTVASFHEVATSATLDVLDSHDNLSRFIELKFGPEAKAEFDKAVLTEQSLRASIQKDFNEAMQNCNKASRSSRKSAGTSSQITCVITSSTPRTRLSKSILSAWGWAIQMFSQKTCARSSYIPVKTCRLISLR
jgi:hypothetical protein